MTLWIAMGLMTVAALAILWPAFRTAKRERAPGSDAARLAVYRDRRRELDLDLAAGKLDASRYEDAKREMEDAAAMELGESSSQAAETPARVMRGTAIAVAAIVGILAWYTYSQIGTPVPPPGQGADPHGTAASSSGEFSTLVERLAARMADNPDDLDGWVLLGRSRLALGDGRGAVDALRQAERLAPEDASVIADLGEALVFTESREGAERIEQALLLDPDQPKALWYGGLLAAERGDTELAALRFEALLELGPPGELREMVVSQLDMLDRAPDTRAPGSTTGAAASEGIAVQVSVDERLAPQVRNGATLFVIARDPDNPVGPPLAAVRRRVDPAGMTVSISDADTMMPGVALTGRSSLLLVARISTTGAAARNAGDLYGEARWTTGDDEPVRVVIDRVVE